MNLKDYELLIKNETSARKWLLGFCWKNHQRYCPRCRSRTLYKLAEGRRRCGRCRYTFHDFSGRYINRGGLSADDWLRLLKLLELEVPVQLMAEQLGMAEATVAKAVTTVRAAIVAGSLDAPACIEAGWATPWEEPAQTPVFGIVEHGGMAFVDLLPELAVESLMHFKSSFRLRTKAVGGMVYTDRYRQYTALATCAQELTHGFIKHTDRGLALDKGSTFWRFARPRLLARQGVSEKSFPLLIKELEFRFNHRQEDLLTLLAQRVCALVPNPAGTGAALPAS
ncbi:transposase [Megalodesulfovibrio paquesii]